MTVTADALDGYHVVGYFGIVVGAVPYFGSTYASGIKNLNGVTTKNVPLALERTRLEAIDRMVEVAITKGANAVIGVRFTSREITGTWKECCCYGTAVILERSAS
jgi:uncharacterized protein YbjQ (UPF0145 family)